jgi:hypothetical protein
MKDIFEGTNHSVFEEFENGRCYIYQQHFDISSNGIYIIPTLDRLYNNQGHSLGSCKLCWKRYNCLKSESYDLEMIKLKV